VSGTTRTTTGIRATPSGKWQARYYDPSGRLRGKTFVRKTDARTFLASTKVEVHRGAWVDPDRAGVRFGELAGEWLGGRLGVRPTSAARDESYVRNHVVPAFGSMAVGRIQRAEVQAWVKALSEGGLAPRTVRTCYRLLGAILAEAVEARTISESPCRRITLPRVPNREQLYLTAEEVEHLVDVVNPLFRPLVYSAVYLGCRWGELVGLRKENLDLLRRQVRIVGTLEEIGGKPRYVEETKSAASRRNLSIPTFLVEVLAKHLADRNVTDLVFLGRDGGLLRRSPFRRRYWKPALEKAGLEEALRFHDLRHTCAGLLIAQGAHPKEIQARLGHASITTTLNTYGHLWPSLGAQLDERIDLVHREARAHVASMWPAAGSEVVSLPGQGQ
jgi:integrase